MPRNYSVTMRCSKNTEANIKMYIKVTVTIRPELTFQVSCNLNVVVALITKTIK